MTADVALLTYGSEEVPLRTLSGAWRERIRRVDQYAMPAALESPVRALLVPMHVDQRFLAAETARIRAFVEGGGRLVVNGHVLYPFVPDLPPFVPLRAGHVEDYRISPLSAHPVWNGVDVPALTFRRGVAGFYARGWHALPPGGLAVNGVGREQRPADLVYPVGKGEVLVHAGNDLWSFADTDGSDRLATQLLAWTVS
jgi:hypothetical protein